MHAKSGRNDPPRWDQVNPTRRPVRTFRFQDGEPGAFEMDYLPKREHNSPLNFSPWHRGYLQSPVLDATGLARGSGRERGPAETHV
jgi:hypothetical protein